MNKKTTIHDIARALNISATTVSFVLNGKAEEKRISEELQKKIHKYVKSVGYQPNLVAKSLRTGKSNIIGMMVEDISDPFFSSIARIIEVKAYKLGYKIFYASTENDTDKTKELIRTFRDRQVDGYIIAPPPGIEDDIRLLLDDHFPVILFDRYFPGLNTCNVVVDNYAGTSQAVGHLQENGYTHIGFVTLESKQTQMVDRMNGYMDALKSSGQQPYALKVPFGLEQGKILDLIKAFLQKNTVLDAVLFGTNYLAISGLEAVCDLQLDIPGDLAVMGFDDNTYFNLFSPSISAVAQPVQELSEEVIKKLLQWLSNAHDAFNPDTTVLPIRLMIRKSSLPVSKMKKTGN